MSHSLPSKFYSRDNRLLFVPFLLLHVYVQPRIDKGPLFTKIVTNYINSSTTCFSFPISNGSWTSFSRKQLLHFFKQLSSAPVFGSSIYLIKTVLMGINFKVFNGSELRPEGWSAVQVRWGGLSRWKCSKLPRPQGRRRAVHSGTRTTYDHVNKARWDRQQLGWGWKGKRGQEHTAPKPGIPGRA